MIRHIAVQTWQKFNLPQPFLLYLLGIGASGGILLLWGVGQVYQSDLQVEFWLLLTLAVLTAFTTSTLKVGDSSITYAVDPIISLAAIPTLGIGAAIVIKSLVTLFTWLSKSYNAQTWKKNWQQLVFNTGMHALATLASALVFVVMREWLGNATTAAKIIPWVPAALVYDQVNLWLLIGILRLQQGDEIDPLEIWREELWATQLFVVTYAVGGGLLAYASQNYDRLGIIIFFLPILLSAHAFRLYVHQMNSYLDGLESIVKTRTVELEDANRQKDSFLAVLSHDMMTPLSSIRYSAELIHSDRESREETQRLAELIIRGQETLFHMVRNILDIEKVISGAAFSTNKQLCDLSLLLHNIAETMTLQATGQRINFYSQIDDELPDVVVDAHQIERIVTNLLSNAFKYTNTGGTVWLTSWAEGEEFFIAVKDTGYGIAPEAIPIIFEQFKRISEHKDKAIGSGLGLAISKALVEEHQGVIEVESEVGVGSKFTVRIPIRPPVA